MQANSGKVRPEENIETPEGDELDFAERKQW